ncbi:sensor histidine kinase [Paenibacillus sp. FSL M7-1046]|uniref:sensor histidine kinase n=1 Tax=Paenibacillus sp. FSL M7-1046 TaxID=2975315 RepID=UPI0030F56084
MKRYLVDRPIQSKLLICFLPILVLSVVLTGFFSYLSSSRQLKENAFYALADTTHQTALFMNDKFLTIFEQLVRLEDNDALQSILSGEGQAADQNRYDDLIKLHDQLDDVYHSYFQMIDSIFVAFNNGRSFNLQQEYVPRQVHIDLNDWLRRYNTSQKGYYWLNSHKDTIFETVEQRRVMSSFKMIGTEHSPASGIVLINLRESYFLEIMENVKISPGGTLMLISPEGELYSKTLDAEYELSGETINALRNGSQDSGSLTADSKAGRKMAIAYNTLPLNHWVLAAVVPEKDILEGATRIKYISLVLILFILIVFIVAAAVVARNLSNPLRYLSKQVKRFERGDLGVSFELDQHNEIGVLARGLSGLVASVAQLLETVRSEQEKKRQIELQAMQAQIQPHFLYNTLSSIKHLIDMNERQRASTMVSALTSYFRISISKGREIIPVREEMEHVRSYLMILNIRYSQEFDFEIKVEDELLELPILKLTLQPLVENAIYHGIKNKHGHGFLSISGRREGDYAVFKVYDNGHGISRDKLSQLRASLESETVGHEAITYGLWNAHRRIVLHFGSRYGLKLDSEEGLYTQVKVYLPYTGDTKGERL